MTHLSKMQLCCPTRVQCLDTETWPLFTVCSEVFLKDPQIHGCFVLVWFGFPGSTLHADREENLDIDAEGPESRSKRAPQIP